jgi:hypothetical protein
MMIMKLEDDLYGSFSVLFGSFTKEEFKVIAKMNYRSWMRYY